MRHSPKVVLAVQSLFVASVAAVIAGCSKPPDDPCSISSESMRRMTRGEFVTRARRLAYNDRFDSLGRPHGAGTAAIRVHRVRGMDRKQRSDLADGCLIARIHSDSADESLGLAAGWTFVWADSSNPYTATMVPEDDGAPMTAFEMSVLPGEPQEGTIASPRYICSDCGQDWCVYPRDSVRLQPAVFDPTAAVGLREAFGAGTATLTAVAPVP